MIATNHEISVQPISKLLRPSTNLSGCVFVGIFRDTRGADLSDEDRVNHFPASPLISVTQVLHGSLHMLPSKGDWQKAPLSPPLPELYVSGPTDSPTISWSKGPCTAITVGFYHDAWITLGGSADYTSLPGSIAEAFQAFEHPQSPTDQWNSFCEALVPHWAANRSVMNGVTDWAKAIAVRAALSSSGQSLRTLERKIKRLSGQSQRELEFYSSLENLHRLSQQHKDASLAEIAQDAGYSDQSHMGRSVRRATGFSPARLNQAIETEEPFWCYRLLGERF